MTDRNVLLIGKNSYIGDHLARYLAVHGFAVRSFSSGECNFLERCRVVDLFASLKGESYTLVFLAVINKTVVNSFQSFSDNLTMVRNLIEGQARAPIASILYFSSVDVYGRKPTLPITEQSKVDPDSWYALGKYVAEWMLSASGEVGAPVTVLRIPGVYGYSPRDRSVIGRLAASIKTEGRVLISASGETLRDYVYVEDLCRLVQELIPRRYSGVLNVASGKAVSIRALARLMGELWQREVSVVQQARNEERDFDLVFDNRRLRALLPRFEFTDLATGIRSYLEAGVGQLTPGAST